MTKKEIVQYLKQNMPEFTGDKVEKEKKMAMYIYIELGKMKVFDEKFYFANPETQEKICKLAQRAKYNINHTAKNKKVICITLSYLYKKILKEFGIRCSTSKPLINDEHIFPIIHFSNGQVIKADITLDLRNIQTKSKTKHFGKSQIYDKEGLSEEEIYNIQKEVGYIDDKSEYMDSKIDKLSKEIEGLPPDETLYKILKNKEVNSIQHDVGYIEQYQYYKSLVRQISDEYYKYKINLVSCYRHVKDSDEKEYSLCIYSIHKDKVDAYMYSKKSSEFIPVSLEKLDELESKGLIIGTNQQDEEVKLLRKYISIEKRKKIMEKIGEEK